MKSRKEVEKLKTDWYTDPCWDIEHSEGFEDYFGELEQYRITCEAYWQRIREQKEKELAEKICPLLSHWVDCGADDIGFNYDNCKLEQCAWWNSQNGQCGILGTK